MEHGVSIFATAEGSPPAEMARLAEVLGFDSLWLTEHSHIPVVADGPYPDSPDGGELPYFYKASLDPFVALSVAAAVTTDLLLGFATCLVVRRDPIETAKAVASLDVVSDGRVIFGVGAGGTAKKCRTTAPTLESEYAGWRSMSTP